MGLTTKFCTFVDAGEAPGRRPGVGRASSPGPGTMPRYINDIIIHCTATPAGKEVTKAEIDRWHRDRGWRGIGYHYIVHLDGSIERGRAISQPGAHCYGHNAHSIGVCYIGGQDESGRPSDTRTPAQKESLLQLTAKLIKMYRCSVHGHNEYSDKACPCFDVQREYGQLRAHLCPIKG